MTDGEDRKLEDADGTVSAADEATDSDDAKTRRKVPQQMPGEIGGPEGLEPTRYGDWEVNGRCTDF